MKPFLIVILAGLAAATCACSSSGTAARPAHTVTITAHAAASRSVAPAPHPSPPTSLVAASCQTSHLSASAGAPQGYRSGLQLVITFKNTGTAACTLHGWPHVWQSTGPPADAIGHPATAGPVPAPTVVTVPPNGTASARLQIEDSALYPARICVPFKATSLAVVPPGEIAARHISFGSTACKGNAKLLTVTAVVQGSGG